MNLEETYAKLTDKQRHVIDALTDWRTQSSYVDGKRVVWFYKGYQRTYGNWAYDTPSGTKAVIESLSKKGFFTVEAKTSTRSLDGFEMHYTLSAEAVELFAAKRAVALAERKQRDAEREERRRIESAKSDAWREATARLMDKYADEFNELKDKLEAEYLAR